MKKIFISCPISKYLNGNNPINDDYKKFIQKLYSLCVNNSKSVYLALERDLYDIKEMASDDVCTLQDYNEIKEADVVIAIPEDSQGVAVEIGWASALNKKIIIVLDQAYNYSPLIKAINVVSESIIININKKDGYSNINDAFFKEIKVILDEINNIKLGDKNNVKQ